jgi:hypothetical protein
VVDAENRTFTFVTAMVKGDSDNHWAIKGRSVLRVMAFIGHGTRKGPHPNSAEFTKVGMPPRKASRRCSMGLAPTGTAL